MRRRPRRGGQGHQHHRRERDRDAPGRRLGEQHAAASRRPARRPREHHGAAGAEPAGRAGPASAPASVSPRHQMPSTSSGQKVEAATAKARPTDWATPTFGGEQRDQDRHRRPRTRPPPGTPDAAERGPCPPTQRLVTSWVSTPATEIARPDDGRQERGERARPSPARSAARRRRPSTISRGSSSTRASERPVGDQVAARRSGRGRRRPAAAGRTAPSRASTTSVVRRAARPSGLV